jgi:APA family basic amino acid/polyamine antiporter
MATAAIAATRPKGHLLRILGVSFGVAVTIGGTIGAGILRTPGEVAGRLHSAWLIVAVWVLGGVYALFGTAAVTELSTMLPRAGGGFVYSKRAFGAYAGFVVGCCDWTLQCVAMSYLATAFGEFMAGLLPGLGGHVKLLAASCIGLLALLNWMGLRQGSRAQELTSLAKALGLIAFVVACFALSPGPSTSAPSPWSALPPSGGGLLIALVLAMEAVIMTYDGWYSAIYFVEEDEDPAHNLPRSAIGGIVACMAVFVLVNLALLKVLPMAQLGASQVPAADAALAVLGSHGGQVILLISIVAVISTINALLMITPRILFGMSRDGLLPQQAASVNAGGTPSIALAVGAAASIVLALSGTFETLIAVASFLAVAVYISGFIALFVLRRREPELARPFRAWGHPWTTGGVLVTSVAFLAGTVVGDLKHALFTLVLVGMSYPVFVLAVRKRPATTVDAPS